jgi:signal transduction histidine kinase
MRNTKDLPRVLLAIFYMATFASLLWMASSIYSMRQTLDQEIHRNFKLSRALDNMTYLATHSVQVIKLLASSGDLQWAEAHEKDTILTKKVFAEAKQIAFTQSILQDIEKIEAERMYLIEMENTSIDFSRQRKVDAAQEVIVSKEYAKTRTRFSEQCHTLLEKVTLISEESLVNFENNITLTLYVIVLTLFAMPTLWYFYYQSMNHWQRSLEQTNQALVKSENEAQAFAKEAELANQTKSEFLTSVSHELRTPMHAILGFSRLLLKHSDAIQDKKLVAMINNIQTSGNRLLNMLNALLDLSKLEAGMANLNFKPQDIRDALNQTLREIDSLLEAKQLRITVQCENTPTVIPHDYQSIVQVFINLLSNAIKFSPVASEITIALSRSTLHSGQPALLCRVMDKGVGIPENEIESVFDKFVQSSKTKSSIGGTGLGLAITQQIVLAHQGKIWAENAPSGGACFNVLLPYERTA